MTQGTTDRNDTKLLLTAAGIIVVGIAGIALIAGLGEQETAGEKRAEQRQKAPVAAARPSAAESGRSTPLFPAVHERATKLAPASTVSEPEAELPPAGPAEEPFEVDPGDDFVARGLDTWQAADYGKAAAYFAAEVEARPERAWSHYMLGLSLWKDGRADEAVAAMETAAGLDPGAVKTWVNLARIQNDLGEFEAALEAARAGASADSESPEARFLEARSLRNLGRPDEALVSLERSLELDPDNPYALNLVGLIRISGGEPGGAIAALERAAELAPGVAYIQNNLGMALELQGARAEAIAAYRRAVELDAAHRKAAANLARLEAIGPAAPVSPAEASIQVAIAGPETRADARTP